MCSNGDLKTLLSAPYNEQQPISLKVSKRGNTHVLDSIEPIVGNSRAAKTNLKNDEKVVNRVLHLA